MLKKIEAVRLEAGRRMGMGDVSRLVVPKPVLVSRRCRAGTSHRATSRRTPAIARMP